MRQWFTLLHKELLEMIRNFKLIWVPIVFILLGASEPLTTYYMPQILDSVGGLPEGAVFEMPEPSPAEVFFSSLSQYDMLGVLIIVLTIMGTISGERKSGVVELILVKPVSFTSFITSKWASGLILLFLSYFAGLIVSWYYVGILFDWIPFIDFLYSFIIYGIWLSFVVTLTIFFNSFLKSPGVVAFLSLAVVLILNIISSSLSTVMEWSPAQLLNYTSEFLMKGSWPEETFIASIIAIVGMVILLVSSILIFRKKELAV